MKFQIIALLFFLLPISVNTVSGQNQQSTQSRQNSIYQDQIRIQDDLFVFSLQITNTTPQQFAFTLSPNDSSVVSAKTFTVFSLNMSDPDRREIFELALCESFFALLDSLNADSNPGSLSLSIDANDAGNLSPASLGQAANDGAPTTGAPTPLTMEQVQATKSQLDAFRTNRSFDAAAFRQQLDQLVSNMDFESRQAISAYGEEVIASNALENDQLKAELMRKAVTFISAANSAISLGNYQTSSNEKFGNSRFDFKAETVADTFKDKFEKKGSFLNRKSVDIGNQTYLLEAKKINGDDTEDRYIFKMSIADMEAFFELESIQATATTINAMAAKMKRVLQQITFERKSQLLSYELTRIYEIATRLDRNPNDYSIIDDDFLSETVKRAADQYGYDSQKLREEFRTTGIFAALQKRRNYGRSNELSRPTIDLEEKISSGAITYSKFNENLDKELRDAASDFLFVAYKNSIEVNSSEWEIGKITINDKVPVYRRGLKFSDFPDEMVSKGKREGDLYPVFEVNIKKAYIEFENEQINNIRLEGKKAGPQNIYASIDKDAKHIFVEIGNQFFKFDLPEYKLDTTDYTYKYFYTKWPVNRQPIYVDDNYLGNVSLGIDNVTRGQTGITEAMISTESDKKRRKSMQKELRQQQKSASGRKDKLIFSFDYCLFINVDRGMFRDYLYDFSGEEKEEDIYADFLENGKAKNLEIKFYADSEKQNLLRTDQVTPNLVFGRQKTFNYDFGSSSLSYGYNTEYDSMNYDFKDEDFSLLANSTIFFDLLEKHNPSITLDNVSDDSLAIKAQMTKYSFASSGYKANKSDFFVDDASMIFSNPYPISYSTKEDVTYYRSNANPNRQKRLYFGDNQHFILLRDAMKNDYTFYNRTENYSPRDQVLEIKDPNVPVPIYKELTRDILKARIYSDFIGFDEDNPNGLVQTEVSKRFFLNTASDPWFGNFLYFGFLSYIEPSLLIAKIEQNNKFLPLQSLNLSGVAGQEDRTVNFVSSLNTLNYSSFRVGAQMGLAYLSIPKFHVRFEFGVGAYINQSGFARNEVTVDTTFNRTVVQEDEFLANSTILYPDIRIEFNPDPRFGLELAYRPTRVSLLSNDIFQVDNQADFIESGGANVQKQWVHVLQLLASIRVNKETNGQFFFRSNFSILGSDRNNNFLQAQIGYAFNIFSNTDQPRSAPPVTETESSDVETAAAED